MDGFVDFYRDWATYKAGFGNLEGEFWLGNDLIHLLTKDGNMKLRVELSDFENNTYVVEYDSFIVADEGDKYRLTLGNYQGSTPPGNISFLTIF